MGQGRPHMGIDPMATVLATVKFHAWLTLDPACSSPLQ